MLATYMQCMHNDNLKIRIVGCSSRPQLVPHTLQPDPGKGIHSLVDISHMMMHCQ